MCGYVNYVGFFIGFKGRLGFVCCRCGLGFFFVVVGVLFELSLYI